MASDMQVIALSLRSRIDECYGEIGLNESLVSCHPDALCDECKQSVARANYWTEQLLEVHRVQGKYLNAISKARQDFPNMVEFVPQASAANFYVSLTV